MLSSNYNNTTIFLFEKITGSKKHDLPYRPSNWISSIDPVQGVLLSRNSKKEKDIFGSIEIISPSLAGVG